MNVSSYMKYKKVSEDFVKSLFLLPFVWAFVFAAKKTDVIAKRIHPMNQSVFSLNGICVLKLVRYL